MNRTIVQQRVLNAIVVGREGDLAIRVAEGFAKVGVVVERVDDPKIAGDKIVRKMPEAVVLLEVLKPESQSAIVERAAAVGALLVQADPTLDEKRFEAFIDKVAREALARRFRRDQAERAGTQTPTVAPPEDPGIDSGWD